MNIEFPAIQNTVQLTDYTQSIQQKEKSSFDVLFNAYLDMFQETNELQVAAEQMQIDFAAGKTDDMVGLNLAMEKASTSLSFTVQVTNKILASYQEIMRMQV